MLMLVTSVWSTPALAQRWQFDAGFVRSELEWAETATLRTRQGTLVFRCVDSQIDAYLTPRLNPGPIRQLSVRLTAPDREPVEQSWPVVAESRSAFSDSPGRLARLIQTGAPVRIEYADPGRAYIELPMSTEQAPEAIGAVMRSCDIPTGDVDALLPGVDTRVIDAVDRLERWHAWNLRYLLLAGEERLSLTARPMSLYRRLNVFYALTLPGVCQDPPSPQWSIPACNGYRARRMRDGVGSFDADPIEALYQFVVFGGRPQVVTGPTRACPTPDAAPRPLRRVNLDRVFVERQDRRLSEASIVAGVSVGVDGVVTAVTVQSARPAGFYERNLEQEVRAIPFEPAVENCEQVPGVYLMRVSLRFSR